MVGTLAGIAGVREEFDRGEGRKPLRADDTLGYW